MSIWPRALLLLATVALAGCTSHRDEVEHSVRAFAQTVAHDVTHDGPSAWRRHFADIPSFFMAVNGQLVFPNSAAVTAGLPDIARALPHIELKWGDSLRIDPLTPDLAVVAAPYHEVLIDSRGQRADSDGFFTGVAERRNG